MKVPFFKQNKINLEYRDGFFQKVQDLFDGSTSLVNGSYTKQFEQSFAEYVGSEYCSFVSNGLDALVLALKASNIGKDDLVVVPSHTYIATWLAPLQLGCKLVVAPVRPDNLLLDVDKLEKYLSPAVRAVMPVHLYGNTCNISQIKKYQSRLNFLVIEDAAQAHGSRAGGSMVGNLGDITCFSFYPTKNLGALGEGGSVTTNSFIIDQKIKSLRNYGRSFDNPAINEFCGSNSRGDELQAAFLLEKLKNISQIKDQRLKIIHQYQKYFSEPQHRLITYQKECSPHLAVLQLESEEIRDSLKMHLYEKGIQTSIHYSVPCHDQPFINTDSLVINDERIIKQASQISKTIISLPMSESHTLEEINYVCECVVNYMAN